MSQTPDTTGRLAGDSLVHTDSLQQRDTVTITPLTDSVSRKPVTKDTGWTFTGSMPADLHGLQSAIMNHHPYFGFSSSPVPVSPEAAKRTVSGKELLFYLMIFLLIVFGFLKRIFQKYFSDLFRLFFRTTIKQRQIKEQLMQTPLPSLLLNAFFVLSAGLYISFLLEHFHLNTIGNFWLLLLYCCAGLSLVYFIKFAGLKIAGWLFGMEEAADSYIFIVFVVNKMLGILLLPFLITIAFTSGEVYTAGLVLSWCLVGGLLLYRFVLTYAAVRNQVKVNPFHFILYLCAFEIAPLLLIYKGLVLFFSITA